LPENSLIARALFQIAVLFCADSCAILDLRQRDRAK
jgi:hypothetical protein